FELVLPKTSDRVYDWIPVELTLSRDDNLLKLRVAGSAIDARISLPKQARGRLSFGMNGIDGFSTTDVPPIAVREINVSADQVRYHWSLDEEEGGQTLDSNHRSIASVTNPLWGKSLHKHWIHAVSLET